MGVINWREKQAENFSREQDLFFGGIVDLPVIR